ncbi:tRNA pseudouridine(13) synthase TruD [Alginatibacterium sediminis]|uniref:tRNA pseudouridine synthase D n=1 Tax=Alginatibacterium sediminis TaxID=2164068 RepID=A0A420ED72_9ALTE|nr:tRNA pseudouridine(13) synthase TruD [Alginatibacterium sediminis]RKF18620.1 tRNA pseudouridine(13) synthase TruD [Alginatibacterium sediminis]
MNINWAYRLGVPQQVLGFKLVPEDFKVFEELPFEFSGDGEHMLVKVQKTGLNTTAVARILAQSLECSIKVVSYAGLKDRNAVTEQWFSIQLPGIDNPKLGPKVQEGLQILDIARHNKKLKRGALSGNRFEIRLRDVSDRHELEQRLQAIKDHGVPNYFGEQRFGHRAQNLDRALEMFGGKKVRDREKRSIYLSAARSFLFNQCVSKRIENETWDQGLNGDCLQFVGKSAFFCNPINDTNSQKRIDNGEVDISGPLFGKGELPTQAQAQLSESEVADSYPEFVKGLSAAGLRMERRANRLRPEQLQWKFEAGDLWLNFSLPKGCYATSVLRELCILDEQERRSTDVPSA